MSTSTLFLRLRFELDATLRGRAFVARALRGRLVAGEYAELVGQLGALFASFEPGSAADLAGLALADAASVGAGRVVSDTFAAPCDAVRFLRRVVQSECARRLDPRAALEASVAVVATSWLSEAASQLRPRFPGATSFLDALGGGSIACLDRLERRVAAEPELTPVLQAFAELERGTVLGVEAHLHFRFPPPVVSGLVARPGTFAGLASIADATGHPDARRPGRGARSRRVP